MNSAPKTSFQRVSEFNQSLLRWSSEVQTDGKSVTVKGGNVLQSQAVPWLESHGKASFFVFFPPSPKNMSEKLAKDTLDFVKYCLRRWHETTYMVEMKGTHSCLHGQFMIVDNWRLIGFFTVCKQW